MNDLMRWIAAGALCSVGWMLSGCSNSGTSPEIAVGGTVTGLVAGASLELEDNGGAPFTVRANGSFTSSSTLTSGASYDVTIAAQPAGENCTVSDGSGTVGSTAVANVLITCTPKHYTISGSLLGLLSGRSLTVQDNGGDGKTLTADGAFSFTTSVASGSNYAVTVLTQPTGQSCAVTKGSGTVAAADVTDVSISCSDDTYNVAVTVSGVIASGLQLEINGADPLSISTNGKFNFNTPIASGSPYAVTIKTQPLDETCTVANGSGTIEGANVTNVSVVCAENTYPIGVTVSGLTGRGLVLQDNGRDNLTVGANGAVKFATPLPSGSTYSVTVLTQPMGQTCAVTSGSGTVTNAGVSGIAVSCVAVYTIGGSLSELASSKTIVLQDNGGDTLTLTANGSFTFAKPLLNGAAYAVTIVTPPQGQTCVVDNGSGTVSAANVTNVTVSCGDLWTWIGGSQTGGQMGVYGTQGVASASNVPGSRFHAISWTDASGNQWMFGGIGEDSAGTNDFLNDLWEFNPTAGTWEWVSGSNIADASGTYGTLNVAATGNAPGAREQGVSWIDASGNLWLFGGYGYDGAGSVGYLNDLWEFNPTAGTWTWIGGSSTRNASGVDGTPGVASTGNVPGARYSDASFTDASGNLWLFGGYGYGPSSSFGNLNDLWKFNPTAGTWEWVSGSAANASGVYGSLGVAAAGNVPGARQGADAWTDASGNFWIFGGKGDDSAGTDDSLNDLWKFNPTAGTWEWVSGSDTVDAEGVYGTMGVAAAGNVPGARYAASTWSDASGNLWLFGGYGYSVCCSSSVGWLNDLWKFNPTAGTWEWVGGSDTDNAHGTSGTQGVAATGNVPGARFFATSWIDASGNLWLFGGVGYDAAGSGYLNDLWKYVP